MDAENIVSNPGMRVVAKLLANTLWGYFALNTNRTQYRIIHDPAAYQDLLQNSRFDIISVYSGSDKHLQVTFTENEELHIGNGRTNVIIAAFVTSHARLKLFRELKKLGKRVLYFDTDSIFFVSRPGWYEPSCGSFLGQFTNEIDPKQGDWIEEFVSAGPKNYAYKTNTGYTDCTVKGLTFNYLTSLLLNYEVIKDIVISDKNRTLKVPQLKFKRNHWHVSTVVESKQYRYVYDKRIVLSNMFTLPYGY